MARKLQDLRRHVGAPVDDVSCAPFQKRLSSKIFHVGVEVLAGAQIAFVELVVRAAENLSKSEMVLVETCQSDQTDVLCSGADDRVQVQRINAAACPADVDDLPSGDWQHLDLDGHRAVLGLRDASMMATDTHFPTLLTRFSGNGVHFVLRFDGYERLGCG